jgi:hypothetical protein
MKAIQLTISNFFKRILNSLLDLNAAFTASLSDNSWLIGSNASATQGVAYVHATFDPGQSVLISADILAVHPRSPLAGKVLLVTSGVYFPALIPVEGDQTLLVPVQWNNQVYFVEPKFVSIFTIAEAFEVAPTLPGGHHGYGCRCWSCVSQL